MIYSLFSQVEDLSSIWQKFECLVRMQLRCKVTLPYLVDIVLLDIELNNVCETWLRVLSRRSVVKSF